MSPNTEFLPFARPSIGPQEEEAVLRVLRSGWLTTGKETKAFEAEFSATVGGRFAMAVSSATAGLHLALEALGTGEGDRVITTPYTFTATAETARYLGAEPVFADLEPGSFNVSPLEIERRIKDCRAGGQRVAAIVPVHLGGLPCDMERILKIAGEQDIPVVEDAAHSFPSLTRLGNAGTLGDLGVFSFYATKTITTGEGGMVVTNREDLARRIAVMRLHGIDRDVWNRYSATTPSWQYAVVEAGYKYNLTDLASALGRVQLGRAREFLERRRQIAARYNQALGGRDYLEAPADGEGHAWHLYLLLLRQERLSLDRDAYIQALADLGIGTSVHYIPLHIMPYYAGRYGLKPTDLPQALDRYQRVISLPIYPSMTEEEVDRVVKAVLTVGDSCYKKLAYEGHQGASKNTPGTKQVH